MEPIELMNQRLADYFGKFDDKPRWRLVFSDDQFENRFGTYNDFSSDGTFLCQKTEVRLVPKYRQWIQHKWVLEKLTEVPQMCQEELLTSLSYEPIWVFEDKKGNPLPPIWLAIEFLISSMQGPKKTFYSDEIQDTEQRVKKLEESLFGNESNITDSLAYKDGVFINGTSNVGTNQSKDDKGTS